MKISQIGGEQPLALGRSWAGAFEPARQASLPVRREMHRGDRFFFWFVRLNAFGVLAILLFIGLFLAVSAWPALKTFGFKFVTSTEWDPAHDAFGALPFIFGTIVSSLLALFFAVPLSVGIALFLNELAPKSLARPVGFLVEMLAAIPSVVFGLWGIFALAPWLRTSVQPALGEYLGFLPLFQGPPYGVGILCAGIILAIMITPTISSIAKEVFRAIPRAQREAALALGATRWEMMSLAVLKTAKRGLMGAVILGLGRALGETMAVTMVIGNRPDISPSLFAPGQSMASVIANEYAEAGSTLHLAALAEIGLVLFAVTFVMNALARIVVWRAKRKFAS